jgi:protein SCO1
MPMLQEKADRVRGGRLAVVQHLSRCAPAMLVALILFVAASNPAGATGWGADYFPNVPLVTHNGKTVRLYDDLLKGKKVAVAVMYTSCSVECPLITARMVQLRRALGDRVGKDIFFYSISIDPWDTPDVLKAYAAKFGAGGPGWEFLTGNDEDIKLVTRKLGLSRLSDRNNLDGHTPSLMIGNVANGQWMRNSAVDNPQFLAATMLNFLGLMDGSIGPSYAQARPLTIDPGRYLFQTRCEGCHSIGQGEKVGPDLGGLAGRHDPAWVAHYVRDPAKMRAERDPAALALMKRYKVRMPGHDLSGQELAALLEFLGIDAETRHGAPERSGGLTH